MNNRMRRGLLWAAIAGSLLAGSQSSLGAPPGGVEGEVTITEHGKPQKDRSNVVVYLVGVPNALPDTSKMVHKVRQRDKQFRPKVTVVLKGSTVEFPNEDKIFHNVFSVSEAARFDLGLYKSGSSKSVQMRKPGVVHVYCNIHPQMVAKIVVLDTKHHFVTSGDGKFRLRGVPPGSYEIVAWQSAGKEYRGKVTIESGKTLSHAVRLVEGQESKEHLRKDGTPYGRYK